jgi:tyrosinase
MAKSSTPSTPPAPEARYARVKAILGAAAAGSRSDYGGLGQFWNLPLHELKEAKIYGVRLIAPAVPTPPCCEGQTSARVSGLVRGLRGLPPFDGSRFPPLMWGGHRVAEDDIALIADWIGDGCPPAMRGAPRSTSAPPSFCGRK